MTAYQEDVRDDRPNTPRPKKRKHTYQILKEEAQRLRVEIQSLRRELAAQEETVGNDNSKLQHASRKNQMLKNAVYSQQLAVASTQSMISNHLNEQRDVPIYACIHLSTKWNARRETLLAMRSAKFMQCYSYLVERCRSLDLEKSRDCTNDRDDCHQTVRHAHTAESHGGHTQQTARLVQELVVFMFNMEITISEALGDITIREDYDSLNDGAYASNHRLVSNHESGVTTEANTVSFAQLFEDEAEVECGAGVGEFTVSVDQDDLYPYDVLDHVGGERRVDGGNHGDGVVECTDGDHGDSAISVLMRRVVFIKVHRPEFDIPEHELIELFDHITKWPDVMIQSVREILSTETL
ncbi:Hypothetical protein PHPALM_1859 [Phytophthora palmivora]|uniref:Uncharacterized protein n=1 Tax=Phytophthora palmivora TaxID=4796 RepID=A0A2P4YRF6_9STRA|nr:Hypothetical protein PHPALM_1859 [Phytophthora palmivora]